MLVQTRAFSYFRDDPRHRVVTDVLEFWRAIEWLAKHSQVAVDTETSGTAWHQHARIAGVAASAWDGEQVQSFYFPIRHQTGEQQLPAHVVVAGMRFILENPAIQKVFHNKKFDQHFFAREGLQVLGTFCRDTMIEAHMYDENSPLDLKARAFTELGFKNALVNENVLLLELKRLAAAARMGIDEFKERTGYARASIWLAGPYACWDTEFTLRLAKKYEDAGILTYFKRIHTTEMKLTNVLFKMEEKGMPCDRGYLEWLSNSAGQAMDLLRPQICAAANFQFDPGSDDEVRHVITNVLGLTHRLWKRTDSGLDWAVDAEVLEQMDDIPAMRHLGQYRIAAKLRSTYTTSIIERLGFDGLIHADFKQVGTVGSRLSCAQPNMQNWPTDDDGRAVAFSGKKLKAGGVDPWSLKRALLVPPRRVRISWDYSQIELRVLAKVSGDPILTEIYLRGEDVHKRTAMEVYGVHDDDTRRLAKIISFGLSYGMSDKGFASQAKIPLEEATRRLATFFQRYMRIKPCQEEFWAAMRRQRPIPAFVNLWGRARRVPGMNATRGWELGRAQRRAFAIWIQGTAGELTKESMVRMDEWEAVNRAGLEPVTTIHDDMQVDVPPENVEQVIRGVTPLLEDYPELAPIPVLTDAKWSNTHMADKREFPEGMVPHVFDARRATA